MMKIKCTEQPEKCLRQCEDGVLTIDDDTVEIYDYCVMCGIPRQSVGKVLRKLMSNWARKAQIRYKNLDGDSRDFVDSKVQEFSRKNSKRLADVVSHEIAEVLELPCPLCSYCQEWKWDGWFGLGFVAEHTIYRIAGE